VRRTPEEARELILAAAEARLARSGPEGLRLQDIAADCGIAHPTILHHFGSRDGLVRALARRAAEQLRERLMSALGAPGTTTERMLADVFDAFRGGLAQRLAWAASTPDKPAPLEHRVALEIATAIQARDAASGSRPVDPEGTRFLVYLVAAAAFGDAMFGEALRRSAGLDDEAAQRFQRWFAALIDARPR
jgi:AcrR family transcriptional regulator